MLTVDVYMQTYDEFLKKYEQFIGEHDPLDHFRKELSVGFKFSEASWYDAHVEFDSSTGRSLHIVGGGTDYGVFISATEPEGGAWVDLEVPAGQQPGRDASKIVRELLRLPGFESLKESPVGQIMDRL